MKKASISIKIIFKDSFVNRLVSQIDYISLDSPKRARKFKSELFIRIKEIHTNPFLYRKSIYFSDENIRDLLFKGYTIVFRVTDNAIEIFGFVKFQNKPTD